MAKNSDPFPVWKRIYSVVNGKRKNISPEAVEDTLNLCKEQIIDVFIQFKNYSKQSFKAWKAESGLKDIVSDDEMCNFIHLLSRELDLDVSVAWTVTCNFLMFEYYGRVDELKTLIKFDSKVEYLTESVWYFYTADRMFLLKTLRHIFENVHDKNHVYFDKFDSFIKTLDINLLWKNLKEVFRNLLDEIDRDKSQMVSEEILAQWIHRNNREQAEVVILLLHTFEYLKPGGSELADILSLFIRHGFTRHPLFHPSVSVSRTNDLTEIKNSEIALILTIMKVYWNTPSLIKMLPPDIERNLELLQIQGDNSIVLFAWASLKTSIINECSEKESYMDYCNRVILELVPKKVFNSLYEFLAHKMFLNTKLGEITTEAVIKLMTEFTKICADFNYVHEQPGVSKLTAELLKRNGLVILETLGPIFQLSMEAFPFIFEPFLDMCKALIVLPEKYDSIMSLLKNIPGFLSELPWAHHSPSFITDQTQRLFTDSDLFMVPSGTLVESFQYQGVGYARFVYPFDFFRLMEQFTKSLSTINFEVGIEWHCYNNLIELVIIGFQFIDHLLKHYQGDIRQDPALRSLVRRLEIVPTQFVEGPSKNFQFIRLYFEVNCTLITKELLDFMEVFSPVHRKKMFPVVVNYDRSNKNILYDRMLNGSLLFRLLKEEEGKDTHCLLIQYLKLIEFMVQKNVYHRELQFAGLWYIINCTFPLYQQWNYADPQEEIAITKTCCSIFVEVLQRHLSKVEDDSVVIFEMLLDSLLLQEPMTSSYISIFLKDKFHLQKLMGQELNWSSGPALGSIECIRLHLVLLLLLLKHKSKFSERKTTLDDKIGFIAKSVSGYIVNPYSIALRKLSCRFLEFLARDKNVPLMALLGLDYDQVQRLYLDRLRDSTETDDLKMYILDLVGTCISSQHGMTAAFFNVKRSRKWYSDNKEKTIECDTVSDFMIDYLQNIKKSLDYLRTPLQIGILHVMANLWVYRKRHLIKDVISLESFWPLLADPLYKEFDQAPIIYGYIFKIFGIQLVDDENDSRFLSSVEKFVCNQEQVKSWTEYMLRTFKKETTNFEEIEDKKYLLRAWMEFIIMLDKTSELRKFNKTAKFEFILMSLEGIHFYVVNTYCIKLWMDLCLLQISSWGITERDKDATVAQKSIEMFSIIKVYYKDFRDDARLSILAVIQNIFEKLRPHFEKRSDELSQLLEQFGLLLEYEYELVQDRLSIIDQTFEATAREQLLPWMMCIRIVNGLFEFKNVEDMNLWFWYRNYANKLMDCTCKLLSRNYTLPLAKMTLYSLSLYAASPIHLDFMNVNFSHFYNTIEPSLTSILYGKNNKLNPTQLEEGWLTCTLLMKFQHALFQSVQHRALPSCYTFITLNEQILTHIFNIPDTTVALKSLDLVISTLSFFDAMMVHWQLEWYRKSNSTYNFVLAGVKKIINACSYTILRPMNIVLYTLDEYGRFNQMDKVPIELTVIIMNKLIIAVSLGFSILYKMNPSLVDLLDVYVPDTATTMIESDFSVPKFELPISTTLTYGMLLCVAHFFCKILDALNLGKAREPNKTAQDFHSRYFAMVEHQDSNDRLPNQKLSAFQRYAMYEYSGLADPWIEKLDCDKVKVSLESLMLFLAQQIFLVVSATDRENISYFKRNLSSELQFFYEHVKKRTSVLVSQAKASASQMSLKEADVLKRYFSQCKSYSGKLDVPQSIWQDMGFETKNDLLVIPNDHQAASLIWWPKMEQISAQVKLQKVQRLACLAITGAIFTCPTAALEVMLNLPPLHLCVMKKAAISAFRLSQTMNLKPGNRIGHLKILENISLESMSKPTDIMPARYDFEMQFDVVINNHQICTENGPQLGRDALVWYTDGSKMEERAGVGVTGPNFRLLKPLGNTPTIFQAEVHAIEICAQECLERGTRRAEIYILSDSQAALKALKSYTCESKLTWDCKQSLRQLAANNQVTLMWVPGHKGIRGNEEADCLAKEGANTQFSGPEPFCGLPKAHLKEEVRRWEADEMTFHWNKVPGQRQAKRLVSFSPRKAKQLLELFKKDLKLVTGLLTGHCPLRYHLKKMGKTESDSCRYCEDVAETAEHLLCECPALFCKRLKFLEGAFLKPSDIRIPGN